MTNPSPAKDSDPTTNDSDSTDNDAGPVADDFAPTTGDERSAVEPPARLTAAVVEHESRPDECTIFPQRASDEELVTTWITAEEGSYVSLDEMR